MENKLSDFVNGLIEENKKLRIDVSIKDTQIEMLLSQIKEWETVFSTDHLSNVGTKDIVDLRNVAFSQQDGGANG